MDYDSPSGKTWGFVYITPPHTQDSPLTSPEEGTGPPSPPPPWPHPHLHVRQSRERKIKNTRVSDAMDASVPSPQFLA
jgi:hypothetical protein